MKVPYNRLARIGLVSVALLALAVACGGSATKPTLKPIPMPAISQASPEPAEPTDTPAPATSVPHTATPDVTVVVPPTTIPTSEPEPTAIPTPANASIPKLTPSPDEGITTLTSEGLINEYSRVLSERLGEGEDAADPFPWADDTFTFVYVPLSSRPFSIDENTESAEDPSYWLNPWAISDLWHADISISWRGEEVLVGVDIQLVLQPISLDAESARFLQRINAEGGPYLLRVRVPSRLDAFSPAERWSKPFDDLQQRGFTPAIVGDLRNLGTTLTGIETHFIQDHDVDQMGTEEILEFHHNTYLYLLPVILECVESVPINQARCIST